MKAPIFILTVYITLAFAMNLDESATSTTETPFASAAASPDVTVEHIKDRVMAMDPALVRNGLVVLEILLSGNATVKYLSLHV